ncbi:hypothetical protein ASPSYDRAFT_1169797 [Aspergillus sydowii CBS 593.65]|uniref:Phytanoyl-CoA dioxygenase n=1 Tax=Aspergillus sydowii CBS 593.65 TaxID=1036612 RepID=A0A1L9SZ76_9EURO|nr:uncharacterized protein ASPSYDRAFT_1169797 [Aspergillus sydowii CBS 593.65]OJJ52381.1 hypothetical protein ASPSYDRAFT_1169797 [Aspergillus sydowii CBS 593.65]
MSTTVTETASPAANTGVTLRAYGGELENVKLLPSFTPDTPIEELRKRYEEEGVVWIKSLISRDVVQKFRKDYLTFMNRGSEMLKPDTDPEEGIFSGNDWRNYILPGGTRLAMGLKDEGPFVDNAIASHVAPFYLQFKDEIAKDIEAFAAKLCVFQDPWCLPRSLLRCAVPGAESTPVHYDQIFLRAAPLTIEGGGLIYLDGSQYIGRKYEEDFSLLNESLSDTEKISAVNKNMNAGGWLDRNSSKFGKYWGRDWLVGAYEAGDVVLHNPFMVHAGAMNESKTGRIRVSTDLRFVDRSKPYDERWTIAAFSDNDPNLARKLNRKPA